MAAVVGNIVTDVVTDLVQNIVNSFGDVISGSPSGEQHTFQGTLGLYNFARASDAWVFDNEGRWQRIQDDLPSYPDALVRENLVPVDLNAWGALQTTNGTVTVAGDGSYADVSVAATLNRAYIHTPIVVEEGFRYRISARLTNVVAPGSDPSRINIRLHGGQQNWTMPTDCVDGVWQQETLTTENNTVPGATMRVGIGTNGNEVQSNFSFRISDVMVERVSGRENEVAANQVSGSEYLTVDNGNTAAASGLVTETAGEAVSTPTGILLERSQTNDLIESEDMSTYTHSGASTIYHSTLLEGRATTRISKSAAQDAVYVDRSVPFTNVDHIVRCRFLAGTLDQATVGLNDGTSFFAYTTAQVVSGPGTLSDGVANRVYISNLSTTVPTVVDLRYDSITAASLWRWYVYPGDNTSATSGNIYAGAHEIASSTKTMTSYKPTYGAAVTRVATECYVDTADMTAFPTAGTVNDFTVWMQFIAQHDSGIEAAHLLCFSAGTSALTHIEIAQTAAGNLTCDKLTATNLTSLSGSISWSRGDTVSVCLSSSSVDGVRLYVDGSQIDAVDTANARAAYASNLTRLTLNSDEAFSSAGIMEVLATEVFNQVLTASEVADLG